MFRTILFLWLCILSITGFSQKFVLDRGLITFFSSAAIEDIKADNKKVSSIFNISSGEIAFSMPNNEFQFEKKLMQQHFNEKYMESEKFPRSTFSGKLEGFSNSKTGDQAVKAIGKLTIHGVTKTVEIPGTVNFTSSTISMKSKFIIVLADYKVKIPQLLWQNIAEQVEVTLELVYNPQ